MTTAAEQRAHDKHIQSMRLVMTAFEAEDEFPTVRAVVEGGIASQIAGITAAISAGRSKVSPKEAADIADSRITAAIEAERKALDRKIEDGTATEADEDLWLRLADTPIRNFYH